ncbi:phytanoyl-CoA dioxygenase family protein, partial [Shewanella sp. MBTL60-007]|uniref:phytanoyl-CoA dioxygenase family protein n=1 Tax=Shewanella sp. MBTL60-007 TaxID=2815911 RepID=UPI001C7FA527
SLPVQHRDRFKSTGSLCNFADHPEFADLICYPKFIDLLKSFGSNDPRWLSGYLISKPAGGPPLFWHQDWWGWRNEVSYQSSPVSLFFMIYLTDTSPENGCLRVIPGSHHYAHELHDLPDAHNRDLSLYKDPTDPAYKSHSDEVAVPIKAGDLLIGDSRLLHGAYANRTTAERPLLILWYLPNFSHLPEEIQAGFNDIYLRKSLDVDAGQIKPKTTEDWPNALYKSIEGLAPLYTGKARPFPWCRRPQIDLMKPWAVKSVKN